jgi:signal transduction histidine kinase
MPRWTRVGILEPVSRVEGIAVHQEGMELGFQSSLRYLDPFRGRSARRRISEEERETLRIVNQKVAAKQSLNDLADFLFERTRELIPCDRIGLAFVDESGRRVVAHYARADYEPLLLTKGYVADLSGGSLEHVIKSGEPRIIDDLEKHALERPASHASGLLVREGVQSSLTCPLVVEGRVVGFLFRDSRRKGAFDSHHVQLEMAISERLSQAVEKAWRIEQLEVANHAYLEMLAFVSHEIKNPIASLVTDTRLLADGYLGPLEPQQVDKMERVIAKGQYLLDLVQDYLDLARIDGGGLELNSRKDVDVVEEIVAPSIDLVSAQIESAGMHLQLGLPPGSVTAECDPALLRIVLVNLLGNAVKYGSAGGDIRITVVREPDRLEISVWNQGPGFMPEDRSRLFQRFSRLRSSHGENKRGTGVGLYSSWRIVQLHNGRIRARSEPGQWAEFAFELAQPLELPR